jgi:UDP-glucose 4-epimerase
MSGRVLVTGGAGFIGSHLVDALVAVGRQVRILDNFAGGKRSNLNPAAELVEGDLRDPATVERAVRDVSAVFHLAALASVPRSIERPEETNAVNVEGTLSLFVRAGRAKVRRVIFASSSSVYGDAVEMPKRETAEPKPLSPYAVSKLAGEHYGRMASAHFGVEVVSLRFFNVYGPRQDPDSPYAAVIPIFLSRLAAGQPLPINGDGGQSRDFTYVGDLVRGIQLAETAKVEPGRVINLAGGTPVGLLEMARTLGKVAGKPVTLEHRPPRAGDIRHSHADPSRAQQELGFRTEITLEEGLRRTWQAHAARTK